jgi:hypothetical protein
MVQIPIFWAECLLSIGADFDMAMWAKNYPTMAEAWEKTPDVWRLAQISILSSLSVPKSEEQVRRDFVQMMLGQWRLAGGPANAPREASMAATKLRRWADARGTPDDPVDAAKLAYDAAYNWGDEADYKLGKTTLDLRWRILGRLADVGRYRARRIAASYAGAAVRDMVDAWPENTAFQDFIRGWATKPDLPFNGLV